MGWPTFPLTCAETGMRSADQINHDPRTDTDSRIGVVGEGPGEFRQGPGRLFALQNDTTAVAEWAGVPLVFMHRNRMLRHNARAAGLPIGVDTVGNGHWFVVDISSNSRFTDRDGRGRLGYSRTIVRTTREFEILDSIATIGGGEIVSAPPSGGRGRGTLRTHKPPEQAIAFSDGWLAIAYLEPYRVDWLQPTGEWIRGAALSQDTLAFERTDYGTVIGAPDGRVLIRRSVRSAPERNTVRYDVVDRSGRLNGFFLVAQNEYVIGPGRQRLYIVTEGPRGLKGVRTVKWPPSP